MQQPFDVFGKNVNFKINMVSRLIITDNRVLPCMRNNGDFERVGSDHCRHSEADPIDGYRTLHGDILAELDGVLNAYTAGIALGFYGKDLASAVDMTLDHVTPEPLSDCEGPLEIDPGTGCQIAERSSPQSFQRGVGAEIVRSQLDYSQVGTVDRYRVSDAGSFKHDAGCNYDQGSVGPPIDAANRAGLNYESSEYPHGQQ